MPRFAFSSAFIFLSCLVFVAAAAEPEAVTGLAPFGADVQVPARTPVVPAKSAFVAAVELLHADQAKAWHVIGGEGGTPYALEAKDGVDALRLDVQRFEPKVTMVGCALPAGTDGDAWGARNAAYVSFLCRSDAGPVRMSAYLASRGKEPEDAALRVQFIAQVGNWQRVVLPFTQFGAKSPARMVELGFLLAAAAPLGGAVRIADIRVGTPAYSEDSWKSQRVSIPLKGQWRFAIDPDGEGVGKGWQQPAWDDSGWKLLEGGKPWQEQGVRHAGWAWYRQQVLIPAVRAGAPVTFNLANIPFDDEVYLNGMRIGGMSGNYKYDDISKRSYTAPAATVHFGEANTIAIRAWGIDGLRWGKNESGLVAGDYVAECDPYALMARSPGGSEMPISRFDLSRAQQSLPFELVLRCPGELARDGKTHVQCLLLDGAGGAIANTSAALAADGDGPAMAILPVNADVARELYLRGRFRLAANLIDGDGVPLACLQYRIDRTCFDAREHEALPALTAIEHDTPYGKLKLVDEIDCSTPIAAEPHPYMQGAWARSNGAFSGAEVQVGVHEILGRQAREGDAGWFAYRVGRGGLTVGKTYVLRVEYPEDKPRYCPMEITSGLNYEDIGWRNGVSAGDLYDNSPLSHAWQWYDAIFVAGERTYGITGAEGAPSTNGIWVFFLNKVVPGKYFAMYQGGPAIARIRLYEIDAARNAPVIRHPAALPQRRLMVDWERQPDCDPLDVTRYCQLMGYSAVAPVIVKWCYDTWGDPQPGFRAHNIDRHGLWIGQEAPVAGSQPVPAVAGAQTIHARYLAAAKACGISYVPRIEYGGSLALPKEARAVGSDGKLAKPSRFVSDSANLLHPATWDDISRLLDGLIKPIANDPTLGGILWRQRCDTLQISFGRADVEMYCRESKLAMPDGGAKAIATWASSGPGAAGYRQWWLRKRVEFHYRVRDLLQSYRKDLDTCYFNWEGDKWNLAVPDQTCSAYFRDMAAAGPGMAMKVYDRNLAVLSKLSGDDFIAMIRSGESYAPGVPGRADLAMDMDLYRNSGRFQVLAPSNFRHFADNPSYLNYFRNAQGLAVADVVNYDENGYKRLHPRFECNMVTSAGSAFSMTVEVEAWFHGDARTMTCTTYTFGRGFADAHRRFAQAFLALPAVPGAELVSTDPEVKIRSYAQGAYIGVANKGGSAKTVTVKLPGHWEKSPMITDLVSGTAVVSRMEADGLAFEVLTGPMELDAFHIQ